MEHGKISDLADAAASEAAADEPAHALLSYLRHAPDATIQSGSVAAADFLGIWRFRFDSFEGLQHAFRGWPGFFHALEQQSAEVNVVSIRGPYEEPTRFIIIVDTSGDQVLACLSRTDSS